MSAPLDAPAISTCPEAPADRDAGEARVARVGAETAGFVPSGRIEHLDPGGPELVFVLLPEQRR
ncbi:MAG TPA: hypothetical protein VFC53_02925 [Dehalococcoidia bacterium]|nr:hypothetical protein [Dehalococcoidia bacterium]